MADTKERVAALDYARCEALSAGQARGQRATDLAVYAMIVELVIAVVLPSLQSTRSCSSGPLRTAAWAMEMVDEILRAAARAAEPLPSSAADLEALVARSGSEFLVQRSILGYEDGAPGEVKIHLHTRDSKALLYQNQGDGQYQISIDPLPKVRVTFNRVALSRQSRVYVDKGSSCRLYEFGLSTFLIARSCLATPE